MGKTDSYINREISWLSFNARVLQEAEDPTVPLFERLRFLGIFSNNLDEFFRVRVASVRRMVDLGDDGSILGNFTPEELHEEIHRVVISHQKKSQEIYRKIMAEMADENIFIIDETKLTSEQGIFVKRYFNEKVLPNLVPIMLAEDHKFPYLRDRSVYLAIKLYRALKPGKFAYALVRVPSITLTRFLVLPARNNKKYIILLDDIIRYCMPDIFPLFKYDRYEAYTIKVTRDAELNIDDDISKSFIEKMELSLKRRKVGTPVRLLYDSNIPEDFLSFILKKMNLDPDNTVAGGRYHNHKDFMNFPEVGSVHHYYKRLTPVRHRNLPPHDSILKKLRQADVMLHYPYQSFSHFLDLLREASIDPKVHEIGITIYRVADNSRVVNALLNAIRNGKRVTVVIELQARFDEEANIYWSNKLQEEGAHVINGVPGLKVHSKLAWIQRKEGNGLRNYAYVGTGNFHEGTARVYGDDGLLTADPRIADEVARLFGFFKHNYRNDQYKHLIVSPFSMRNFFVSMIDKEIEIAKSGKKAYMILKMNSLIDPGMIDKIAEAARAGVKVQLIVRGIFGLKTEEEGVRENLEAISIVDKYLEHSRIFLFGNDGEEKMFISSADWMPRNLNRRIEVACPIYDLDIQDELKQMLILQLKDNAKSRILDNALSNRYNHKTIGGRYRSQEDFYQYIKDKHQVIMKIYHNPRCSKSRAGLQFLEENGYPVDIVNYLKDGISEEEIRNIIQLTGMSAFDLVRTQEELYRTEFRDKPMSEDDWVKALSANPKLLKRPIVLNGTKAVLAQPAELIDKIL
ncbi:polyphosphate kinase 1 [Mangrovibacterium marinum]|uniref:Polyphosphate kinase n=1 Tax=Mangrovibacterium marinum TaxID=1639118 RepID=A0A2T5C148_9BACT|nr:polyphosphate kinase 1 [Mangrovibacterium marinum]PTN08332.1 polyphosphate kinase [Mangrovibacterium marinum]